MAKNILIKVKRKIKSTAISEYLRKIVIIIIFLWVVSIFINIRLALFFSVIMILNSKLENNLVRRGIPARLELGTFATVLAATVFGIHSGIIIGVSSRIFASVYTKNFAPDHTLIILSTLIVSFLANTFSSLEIVSLGIGISIFINIIMFFAAKYGLGFADSINIPLIASNLILNILLFLTLGEALFSILI